MLNTIRNAIVGALVAGMMSVAAVAAVGTPPGSGPQLVDGIWLNGLAAGSNATYQAGITATGTTQATAVQLPAQITLFEIDTVASSTGVALPPALAGTEISIYNNGANTVTVFPSINNNQALSPAAQDTINNGTSTTIATHSTLYFFCAKNGIWAAK